MKMNLKEVTKTDKFFMMAQRFYWLMMQLLVVLLKCIMSNGQ